MNQMRQKSFGFTPRPRVNRKEDLLLTGRRLLRRSGDIIDYIHCYDIFEGEVSGSGLITLI